VVDCGLGFWSVWLGSVCVRVCVGIVWCWSVSDILGQGEGYGPCVSVGVLGLVCLGLGGPLGKLCQCYGLCVRDKVSVSGFVLVCQRWYVRFG
jgi:hypothetical protein